MMMLAKKMGFHCLGARRNSVPERARGATPFVTNESANWGL